MAFWDSLDTLFTLGKGAMALSSSFDNINELNYMKNFYETQSMINQEQAAFNESVIRRTGDRQAAKIMMQGDAFISTQMNNLGVRGIALEGSPELFIDKTRAATYDALEENAFQTEVAAINTRFSGLTGSFNNQQQSRAMGSMQRQERRSMWDMVFGAAKTLNQLGSPHVANPFQAVFGRSGQNE